MRRALNLFGGKKEGGDKGPGMMDQLNMFKKAQEMATKKKTLKDFEAYLNQVYKQNHGDQ